MNPTSKSWIPGVLWSAGCDLAIAANFLITWLWPYTFGERMVHRLCFVMLLEFLVVHATGFFTAVGSKQSTRWGRAGMSAGLLVLYALFAAAFSAMYGSAWPFLAFFMLMLPRLPQIVLNPPGDDHQFLLMGSWAAMTALYLFGIFFTVVADIPPLGVTPEVIAAQEFGIGGVWPEEPYRVLAFGAIYFAGLALVHALTQFGEHRLLPKEGMGNT